MVYLAKAVEGYERTSIADEQDAACVQSLALIAYTSVVDNADNAANRGVNALLSRFSERPDVAAIRRFAVAFLTVDVTALERALDEIEGAVNDSAVLRALRHYESMLKRNLLLK